jgi:hypothetical protein
MAARSIQAVGTRLCDIKIVPVLTDILLKTEEQPIPDGRENG